MIFRIKYQIDCLEKLLVEDENEKELEILKKYEEENNFKQSVRAQEETGVWHLEKAPFKVKKRRGRPPGKKK
jgi:hypothetical protein